MRRVAPLVISSLLVGACSGLPEPTAARETTTSTAAGLEATETVLSVATTIPDALALTDTSMPGRISIDTGSTTTTAVTESAGGGGATQTPVTRPSSAGPVATGAPPATVDPMTLYVGVLGGLGFDEQVVEPVGTVARPAGAPLTGLGADPGRRAIVVKIDNSTRARPHAGLDRADLIVEEEVEWGITRLAAIFHTDGGVVGPVRSGRTTDLSILAGLGGPGFVYSGANDVTDAVLRSDDSVINLSAARTGGYWRQPGRRAPSNLFIDLADVWATLDAGSANPMFAIGTAPTGGAPTATFGVGYPNNAVRWDWDGARWQRFQGGSAHALDTGDQLAVDNVVVIETERVATGLHDSAGGVVPEFVFVGTGRAAVFVDGARVEATWTRPSLRSAVSLTSADGTALELKPGTTWVQLLDPSITWG